jgi:hypothetical protein
MRRSHAFLLILGALALLFGLMVGHASLRRRALRPVLLEQGRLVRELGLTDLCLSAEANYTRHLSQADYSAAFQDHPVSLEHFPSGTWLRPNLQAGHGHGQLDRTTKKHP